MKKNDIVETPSGTFRILSLEKEKVLAINCEKKRHCEKFCVKRNPIRRCP